jgi:CrcB protein
MMEDGHSARPSTSEALAPTLLAGKIFQWRWSSPQPPFRADDSYQPTKENSIVRDFFTISLGAIAGANARYFLSRYAAKVMGPVFPYGTLVINVTGSIVVGFFMIWATERVLIDPRWRLLIVVGFCGAYTTFSGYAFETMAYFEQGQWLLMFTNFFSNNFLCLAGALAGMALARAL